jgi:hypothetical protein
VTMAVKIITVEGKPDFDCPISWTVEQAKNEIRSGYVLAGGFLREDGVILLGAVLISSTTGALSFTHAQAQRGIFNDLMWRLFVLLVQPCCRFIFKIHIYHIFIMSLSILALNSCSMESILSVRVVS